MKYAVIDIGSNSVRLLISQNGETKLKTLQTTRLANAVENGFINFEKAKPTFDVISNFTIKAKEFGVDKIYAFATAAVRNAQNGKEFVETLDKQNNIKIEILSGEQESKIGLIGVLGKNDGGVIDIGGASSEIAVKKNGEIVYAKSIPIGAVTLTKLAGNNINKAKEIADSFVASFFNVPKANFFAIGGTATCVASILQKLSVYDPNIIDGYVIEYNNLINLQEELYSLSVEERKKIVGLQIERADIIQSGVTILYSIANKLGIEKLTVSEKDNLEGYLLLKSENV